MRWIIGTSMRLQYLMIVLAAALMFFGIIQIQEMPVDVYPEFNPPLVEVQTEALGLSAVEMEALITVPLEADLLNGIAWLDQIYSETVTGLSSILLVFEPGTDPIRARQMVQERLTQTFALPNVSSPPTMLNPLSSSSRVMMVGLSSTDMSLMDMSVLARWNIKPRLMGVPGVANVAIWGQREWQLQVQVNPERLASQDVTLQQVIQTTGEAMWVSPLSYLESSTPGTAGWIDTPNQRLGIQHLLAISAAEDMAKVPVVGTEDLQLGDVTSVVEDHQQLIGDALLTDGPGLILVIEKFPNTNTLDVTRGVEEALEALEPGLGGIQIDTTIFRPANYLEQSISNLSTLALVSAVLVVLIVAASYFGWRTAVISLIAIPFSLVIAMFVLSLRGVTFNAVVLAGLVMAIGIVVDDAIVDVENIARRLRERNPGENDEESTFSIIADAAMAVRGPLWFATLIVLIIIVPLFLLEGLTGLFLRPLVVSFVVALFASLATALILTPALSFVLLRHIPAKREDPPLVRALQNGYDGLVARVINNPIPAIGAAVLVVAIGVVSLLILEESLMPTFKQTEVRIQWDGAPSVSREAMLRVASLASSELRAIPGVTNVGSHIGRAITGDATVGINSGDIWVTIDPDADYDETLAAIRSVVGGYAGLFRTVETYQPERLDQVLTRPAQDIVVRVYGHELDQLEEVAANVREAIVGIDGVVDAQTDITVQEPQLEIEVDLAAADRFQIKPGDVRRAATTLLSGLTVGHLYEENKVFEVVVWSEPGLRDSLTDVENLLIDTPTGQVPLGELAEIRIAPSPIVIRRDAVQRFVDVTANVSGRDVDAVAADVKAALTGVTFPLEYHAEVLQDTLEQRIIPQNLALILVIVVIGAFLLMQASFESWSLAVVGILVLPVALVGGVFAILLDGGVLSLGSLLGLLAVLVFAIRHTVVLSNHLKSRAREEGTEFGPELVMEGVRERIGALLTSTLATVLVILPIVVSGNIAGTEILHPMDVVILGGLITTTLVNLFLFPPLYLRFGARAGAETLSTEESMQPSYAQ